MTARYLTADLDSEHDTICKFHRENKEATSAAFIDILGLLTLGKVSTDGTHIVYLVADLPYSLFFIG